MGETEDVILALYGAFRRQDIDLLIAGMHPEAAFKPVPTASTYHGREEIRRFFEHDIHELVEFDFRVLNVQESGPRALLHGRNRVRDADGVRDLPIYWYAEVNEGMLRLFQPYAQFADALTAYEEGRG